MDMQKEREAFEALHNQKIFKWFEFDSSVNAYVLKDISATLEKLTALAELNYGWDMWQAAKASAVPDGYVVVPKEPTWEMIDAGENACYGDDEEICKISYKAMIEAAQEQNQ